MTVHICSPPLEKSERRILRCPDCRKRCRARVDYFEWYSPDVTCGGCGRRWTEGGWLYPLTPRIDRARNKQHVHELWNSESES